MHVHNKHHQQNINLLSLGFKKIHLGNRFGGEKQQILHLNLNQNETYMFSNIYSSVTRRRRILKPRFLLCFTWPNCQILATGGVCVCSFLRFRIYVLLYIHLFKGSLVTLKFQIFGHKLRFLNIFQNYKVHVRKNYFGPGNGIEALCFIANCMYFFL